MKIQYPLSTIEPTCTFCKAGAERTPVAQEERDYYGQPDFVHTPAQLAEVRETLPPGYRHCAEQSYPMFCSMSVWMVAALDEIAELRDLLVEARRPGPNLQAEVEASAAEVAARKFEQQGNAASANGLAGEAGFWFRRADNVRAAAKRDADAAKRDA